MKRDSSKIVVLVLGTVVGCGLPAAFADGCPDSEKAAARGQLNKAETAEKAGKLKEAYSAARSTAWECLGHETGRQREAIIKRTGKALGDQDEKAGRLKQAFDWYEGSGNPAEADRVKMKQVKTKPDDINTVSNALSHFGYRKNEGQVKELRALAAQNADRWLVAEEEAFAATKDSRTELGKAKDWLDYAGTGPKKAQDRAEKRGDTLAAENGRRFLELAIAYYSFADKPQKVKGVKDKARGLADSHARKGESEIAADYYNMAGLSAEADKVQKQGETKKQRAEQQRQKQFKKDQDSLEKQLGL
jgi:hypothetical protein